MISYTEIFIVLLIVVVAATYIVYSVFLPAFRRKADNSKTGCSGDCACDAKDKIEELIKKK